MARSPCHFPQASTPSPQITHVLALSSALSHWKVYVNGSQTLHLTFFLGWESDTDPGLIDYTREIVASFVPPRLVTSLAILNGELRREDRIALFMDLPSLTHLAITSPDSLLDGEALSMVDRPGPEGEVLCLSLEHLFFSWVHTSDRLRVQRLPHPDAGVPSGRGHSPELPHSHGQREEDYPKTWRPYGAASSHAFCRTVASLLVRRGVYVGRPL